MNLFKRYGIKEVADVVFYSITRVGDEEFYTPVLKLDTLKVSTIEKTAEKVSATGGKGNKKLITWNFGKELTLNLTDALFSPASMSMIWGGELQAKLAPYTSAIAKLNIANKYGSLHYSTKAYPSPSLTKEEWEIVFKAAQAKHDVGDGKIPSYLGSIVDPGKEATDKYLYWIPNYDGDNADIEANRKYLKEYYFKRSWVDRFIQNNDKTADEQYKMPFNISTWKKIGTFSQFPISSNFSLNSETNKNLYNSWFKSQAAMPESVIAEIFSQIDELKKLGRIETQIYDTEVVDRMETCTVQNPYGLRISTKTQKENLMKYYRNDESSSYVIYYDVNTMLPLLNVTDEGFIRGGADDSDKDVFVLATGTKYIKWSRTVKRKTSEDDGCLGKTFVIDSDTFPEAYKIVGETYIRDEKTGKDQRFQFIIHRAKVAADTSITLEAEGDPTIFEMQIDVLAPKNDIQMELKEFEVDDDFVHGGTRIVPQRSSYLPTQVDLEQKPKVDFTNDELY